MSDKKNLVKNILSLSIVQIANYVLPLASVPIIVRIIGPDSMESLITIVHSWLILCCLLITSALISTMKLNPDVVLVAPRFINLNTKKPGCIMLNISKWQVKNIWPKTDIGLINVLFAINSASVISIKNLPADIYYDERLIIDGTDIDFALL